MNKVLSDERLGSKPRVTENRCVLFNSLTYVYLALLPQHWTLYAKVDTTPIFIKMYIYIFFSDWRQQVLQTVICKVWSGNIDVRLPFVYVEVKFTCILAVGHLDFQHWRTKKYTSRIWMNTIKNWRIKRQTRSNISVCKWLRTHSVVLRPIGAHLKLNSDPGFFIPSFKSHFVIIFFTLFEESNNHQDYSQ